MSELSLSPIRATRRASNGRGAFDVVRTFVRQWYAERRLRERDGSFRSTDPQTLLRTYGAMSVRDFEDVNGPQEWFNRHVIPRAVRGQSRARPWRIVDLGCGSGGSSGILLANAPAGSRLVGYDVCPTLLERARHRAYRDAGGTPVTARFVCQSITEPLRTEAGGRLPAGSIDLAHSAGVVGHHLSLAGVRALARELRRVLAPDGVAILDAGPRMTPDRLQRVLLDAGFVVAAKHRMVPFGPRVAMTFRRLELHG